MSRMILKETTTTIALLYNYIASRDMLLSAEKVDEFDEIVNTNLEEMNIKLIYPLDSSKLIYFISWDENGNQYYILKHDFDAERSVIDYIYERPVAISKATQKENALDMLGLKLENGDIKTKENKVRKKTLKK